MILTPRFTPQELALVVEVLEHVAEDLPHEIHHTDYWRMRQDLLRRLRTVGRLAERLRGELHEHGTPVP
jgi:hypothetical protein